MGKQVLVKSVLTSSHNLKQQMWTSLPIILAALLYPIAASLRRYAGKMNRPKMSDNLTDGTKRNVDIWFWG